MRAHIIYFNFLQPDGNGMSIGGIQTYITNLIPVLRDCGYEVSIYQRSINNFHQDLEGYDVYGIGHPKNGCPEVAAAILEKALTHIDAHHDLLIYGCESCITRKVPYPTIAIQHGISWDIAQEECSPLRYFRHYVGKCYLAWKTNQRVNKVDRLVCVDYNFVNWHRAITPYAKTKHIVIPNFAAIPPTLPAKNNDSIRIIFARRFFPYRGTRLFAHVATRLLQEYPNLFITIAGSGPDAAFMHEQLRGIKNVAFITYNSQNSLTIHQDQDIAVIPTQGSEGTSLSLLEAMAAGCDVVCTNVGGMTNIVLDGYNGLMTSTDEEAVYDALRRLIDNPSLRTTLQHRAYDTVKEAFSIDRWAQKWTEVIKSTQNEAVK